MAEGFQYRNIMISMLSGHDASVSAEPFQQVCSNYTWNITVCFSGIVGGTPIVSVKVSNDGVKFFEYNNCSVNETDETFAFYDSILAFPYIQLCYDPNGVTGGNIDVDLTLKPT